FRARGERRHAGQEENSKAQPKQGRASRKAVYDGSLRKLSMSSVHDSDFGDHGVRVLAMERPGDREIETPRGLLWEFTDEQVSEFDRQAASNLIEPNRAPGRHLFRQ